MKRGNYNNFHECESCKNAKLVCCMFSGRFLCFSLFPELKQTVME